MGRTKQTPRGSASHRPVGMMAATFTGTGRGKAGPEEQYIGALEEDTEEDLLLVLEDAEKQPKEGTIAISKSGDQNSGRNGENGRQDLQRVDVDVPPTKLQKDQPQRQ